MSAAATELSSNSGKYVMDIERRARHASVVLLTGMSGTGKSAALAALVARGHRVVDTDKPGWIVDSTSVDGAEPLWDLDRVAAVVEQHQAGSLFIAGCVANQEAMYERFDAIVLLSATR